jgi:uroporphyrin-III C-methyltransferase/precorrin-2 dehydrogenase/sirohydrochlorin ferrochelatase
MANDIQNDSEVTLRGPAPTRPARMDALAVLPVFFKLGGKRAVLAGGGEPAAWKAELLSACGAQVEVFAEDISQEMRAVAAAPPAGSITLYERRWQPADIPGAAIAIGAITDDEEGAAFFAAARAAGVPVNVVDRPELCEFQFGSIVNRSPLVVAISTDGAAPVFGQAIRSRIEALLPTGFKRWAQAAKAWRREGERLGRTIAERRRFWELFTERALNDATAAPTDEVREELIAQTDGVRSQNPAGGFVSLVGAGPGDPELLTLRAVRALRSADVVLYDDLVSVPVLEFSRRESKRILVGKTGYGPACKQTEINALMVKLAREGQRVVRLKSGEPMIFGRAGEEMDELRAAGIAFEVIPGISAVQAAAADLQVSLTHRDHAKRLQLVTGHSREGRLPGTLSWPALADANATTAVYMAQRTFAELAARLLAEGMDPATPAFAMFAITRDDARRIEGTIATLAELLAQAGVSGPCLVLYGKALSGAAAAQANAAHHA